MYCVVMAGGSGTRFWPMSRKLKPKQLLKIVGDQTMLQITVDRLMKCKKQMIYSFLLVKIYQLLLKKK